VVAAWRAVGLGVGAYALAAPAAPVRLADETTAILSRRLNGG
jgi:hypothetical protein